MQRSDCRIRVVVIVLATGLKTAEAAPPAVPSPAAMAEAEKALRMIRAPAGLDLKVWAAEPLLQNIVAFSFDERGRMFVAETARLHTGVLDARGRRGWPSEAFKKKASKDRMANIEVELLDGELGAKTVEDRERYIRTYFEGELDRFTKDTDTIRRVVDVDGDGRADSSTVFAEGFNKILDGAAAGVLARKGDVWLTNIPSVWRLRDRNDDGVADERTEVARGFGVRFAFIGHDLHGLRLGPDGRLYFSNGDRGATIKTGQGRVLATPETGAVYRMELDGSNLELFATGLRNPQELAFDHLGNLLTGDNNSDGGDRARLVHLVEGGDSGWRVGYQYLTEPGPRGPWNEEKLWHPHHPGQAAYLVPPIENLGNGPSGLTYHPGTGSLSRFKGNFFLADFRGQASLSGVYAIRLAPRGAGLRLATSTKLAWGVLVTDVDFGPDGAFYLSDWVEGWNPTGKGRIYRVTDGGMTEPTPSFEAPATVLASDLRKRPAPELAGLLAHPDARVRLETQLALADAGFAWDLGHAAIEGATLETRLAGIWGLGYMLRRKITPRAHPQAGAPVATDVVLGGLLGDPASEVRAQAAHMLGDARAAGAADALIERLADRDPRVRFFAAIALGNLRHANALPAIVKLIIEDAGRDPVLRHAGVMALAGVASPEVLAAFASHVKQPVRLAAALALRRLGSPEVARFLADRDLLVAREAARAINDVPIEAAMPALAAAADNSVHLADSVMLPRIAHANFREGSEKAAGRLAALATNRRLALNGRRAAVNFLGAWAEPRPRDQVTGAYRDLPPGTRDAELARRVLAGNLAAVLGRAPPEVLTASARAVATLNLVAAGPHLAKLATTRRSTPEVRLNALRAMEDLGAPELVPALPLAARDPDHKVRLWAYHAQVKREPERAAEHVTRALRAPTMHERQAAVETLSWLSGDAADAHLGDLLDRFAAGTLPRELTLDVIEAAEKRAKNHPGSKVGAKLARLVQARAENESLAYADTLVGGNLDAGRHIFFNHPLVQCRRCHSIEGHGTEVGPELLGIGRRKSRGYLMESIVYPSKHFATGFESVMVTMKSGDIHGGTVKKETPRTLALDSVDEGKLVVEKRDIKERERGVSSMPEGFGAILTKRELRDLIEFLATAR
jgi:quinoprotein glucose dehydrogenase